MVQWVNTAGDIASAATALSGLLLVFIGAIAAGFESYDVEHQGAVRKAFLLKGGLALAGFSLGLVAAALALTGKLTENPCYVQWAVGGLGLSFVVVFFAAVLSVWEMK